MENNVLKSHSQTSFKGLFTMNWNGGYNKHNIHGLLLYPFTLTIYTDALTQEICELSARVNVKESYV